MEDVAAQVVKARKAARQLRRLYRSPGVTAATNSAISRHQSNYLDAVTALIEAGQRELVKLLTEEGRLQNLVSECKSTDIRWVDLLSRLREGRIRISAIVGSLEEPT